TTLSYTIGAAATTADSGVTLGGGAANDTGATVTISGNYDSSHDTLAFTNQNGITGNWNSGTGVLTLTGTTTRANYQTALRSITFVSSTGGTQATRTLTFTCTDGT